MAAAALRHTDWPLNVPPSRLQEIARGVFRRFLLPILHTKNLRQIAVSYQAAIFLQAWLKLSTLPYFASGGPKKSLFVVWATQLPNSHAAQQQQPYQ
jgi:hypothetical protein